MTQALVICVVLAIFACSVIRARMLDSARRYLAAVPLNIFAAAHNHEGLHLLLDQFRKEMPEQSIIAFWAIWRDQLDRILSLRVGLAALRQTKIGWRNCGQILELFYQSGAEANLIFEIQKQLWNLKNKKRQCLNLFQDMQIARFDNPNLPVMVLRAVAKAKLVFLKAQHRALSVQGVQVKNWEAIHSMLHDSLVTLNLAEMMVPEIHGKRSESAATARLES